MALTHNLKVQERVIKSKGHLQEIRRKAQVPGIIYGKDMQAQPISLNKRDLTKVFNTVGSRGLFSLEMEAGKSLGVVLVREVQRDPLTQEITHVDFLRVKMDEKITSSIPIFITGEEEIIKKGCVLQAGLKELHISCLPKDLPEHLTCDVSHLEIGDRVLVTDLPIPEGVEVLIETDSLVASVLAPAKGSEEEDEEVPEGEEAKAAE
ncbi:MAG: 50S ribosomal protein L25 [Syntrophomonadaceae bacterium]|jgi:large subunit ribosomal protein L25